MLDRLIRDGHRPSADEYIALAYDGDVGAESDPDNVIGILRELDELGA